MPLSIYLVKAADYPGQTNVETMQFALRFPVVVHKLVLAFVGAKMINLFNLDRFLAINKIYYTGE